MSKQLKQRMIAARTLILRAALAAAALLALAAPISAEATVTLDAVSTTSGQLSPFVFNHTVGNGSDRYLLVGISLRQAGGAAGVSVTLGVQALTLMGSQVNNGNRKVEIWGLANPASGSGTVTATISGGSPDSVISAMSFAGVAQMAPASVEFFSATGNSATPSVTVCPAASTDCPMVEGDLAVSVIAARGSDGLATAVVPSGAGETISIDAQSTSTVNNAATRTFSHTIASPGTGGLARKLIVGVGVEESTDSCATPGNMDVITVTYAGVALTHIPGADNCVFSDSGGTDFEQRLEMWYADEDALGGVSGANNVIATLAGAVDNLTVGAVSVLGAAVGEPEQVAINSALNAASITTNIAAGTLNALLVDIAGSGNSGTFAPGTGQVEAWDTAAASSSAAMSTKLAIAAAANSMTQTASPNANRFVQSVLRLAPRSATLYSLQEGPNNPDASGAASAIGGSGLSIAMDWTLPAAARWALGAVLLKQSVIATRATVGTVSAYDTPHGPVVQWETLSEHGTLGFHVRRYSESSARFERINHRLLPGLLHSPHGGTYRLRDAGVRVGETHVYEIVEREANGSILVHGPYTVSVAPSAAAAGVGVGVGVDAQSGDRADVNARDGYSRRARAASAASHKRQRAKHVARNAQRRAKRNRRGTRVGRRHHDRHALPACHGNCTSVRIANPARARVDRTRQIATEHGWRRGCNMIRW